MKNRVDAQVQPRPTPAVKLDRRVSDTQTCRIAHMCAICRRPGETPNRLDVYSPFMTGNQCELSAIIDNVQAPKPVAAQRVTATNGNPWE